ncbi:MAG: 16S rRNA (cytidine(1402)-2'-O)-methyltransferase [Streptosporangiaceae bacterium]
MDTGIHERDDLEGTPQAGPHRAGGGTGRLILAAAPIGQAKDASGRLARALADTPVIAAEDTRRLRRLAAALGVTLTARVVSYYESVEVARGPALVEALLAGQDVLLITDAGMPGISDPGYRLTAGAIAAGAGVTVLPGPSAVTAAVAVSGLPSDRFCFEGFPARKAGERARAFSALAGERRTMVFFESPRRLGRTLTGLAEAFGRDRAAVVCRELTKTHEEIKRGPLGELAAWAGDGVLGEITIVVAGATAPGRAGTGTGTGAGAGTAADAAALVAAAETAGRPRKEAIAQVAADLALPKRDVYQAVVQAKSRVP